MGLNVWNIALEAKYITIWNMERKICPLLVNHMFLNFYTTSLLLPSFVFQNSTFELEFMKKQKLP
jgi:hypothetical protein